MKATELRIGNYALNKELGIGTIHGVNKECVQFDVNVKTAKTRLYGIYMLNHDELEPIPITEDILLKAGFEYKLDRQKGLRLDFDKFSVLKIRRIDNLIQLYSGKDLIKNFCNMNIHQLQNLCFALTGEELTINF